MKKHQFGLSLCLILLLVASACDTQPISNIRLFVGQADGVTAEKMMIVDGQGQEARFGAIRQLEVDSIGNLYVTDLGPEHETAKSEKLYRWTSIRKVTPDGRVSTMIGRGEKRDLIESSRRAMAIRFDHLYLNSAGCLMKADLKKEPVQFDVFFGRCFTLEEVQGLQASEAPIELEEQTKAIYRLSAEPIMPGHEIFYDVRNIYNSRATHLKITQNDQVIFNDKRFSLLDQSGFNSRYRMDSEERIYGIIEGAPGPGVPGDNFIVRIKDVNSPGLSEAIHEDKLNSPLASFLALDNHDNIYVLDQDVIKRIDQQGRVQNLAQLKDTLKETASQKEFIWDQVVDPQRTYLYFATDTAIYKIPLPPTTTP